MQDLGRRSGFRIERHSLFSDGTMKLLSFTTQRVEVWQGVLGSFRLGYGRRHLRVNMVEIAFKSNQRVSAILKALAQFSGFFSLLDCSTKAASANFLGANAFIQIRE